MALQHPREPWLEEQHHGRQQQQQQRQQQHQQQQHCDLSASRATAAAAANAGGPFFLTDESLSQVDPALDLFGLQSYTWQTQLQPFSGVDHVQQAGESTWQRQHQPLQQLQSCNLSLVGHEAQPLPKIPEQMLSPRSSLPSTPAETEALFAQISSYLNVPSVAQPSALAQLSVSPKLDGHGSSPLSASVSAEPTLYDSLWQPPDVVADKGWRSSFSSSFLDAENSTSWESAPVQRLKRRFGATCDHCRNVHLRCDLPSRSSWGATPSSLPSVLCQADKQQATPAGLISCSRCKAKGLKCTMTPTRLSERTPSFNRSGTVIQKARSLHGSLAPGAQKVEEQASALITAVCAATALRPTACRITDHVMARSLTVRLINCYFAVCHVQLPVVDYVDFRARFNVADGDPRRMSLLANAGRQQAGPQVTVGSPASSEALLAVLVAWAARYTDAPLAFGVTSQDAAGHTSSSSPFTSPTEGRRDSMDTTQQPKRKRKRGVACDSCRLRRVRCDITEVATGSSCSRCVEKGIYCTDEYIRSTQAKSKRKAASISSNDGDSVSLTKVFDAFLDTSPSLTSSISLSAWMPSADAVGGSGTSAQRALAWRRGRQRKAFCMAALQHALGLASKHDLVNRPSVESVQVLTLLSSLLESVDVAQSQHFIKAACGHLEKLGLTAQLTLNISDPKSVEKGLRGLQTQRSYMVPWCLDAIASLLLRRPPSFAHEWIVKLEVNPPHHIEQQQAQQPSLSLAPTQMCGMTHATGVGLSITTMLQLGAVARFIGKHIVPRAEMAQRIDRLQRACQAAWSNLDSLICMLDRSASSVDTALEFMSALHPLGWVGTTKVLASLLHLAVVRALSEQCVALASQNAPDDLQAMQMLQEQGMLRAIESCRRTSHFIKVMLPLGIIQFRCSTFKQIPHLAKFLAQAPTVAELQGETDFHTRQPSPPIDALPSSEKRQGEVLRSVEGLGRAQLGPFTKAAKQKEVEWLVAALLQLGYAWDEMPDEANDVQSLLLSQGLDELPA